MLLHLVGRLTRPLLIQGVRLRMSRFLIMNPWFIPWKNRTSGSCNPNEIEVLPRKIIFFRLLEVINISVVEECIITKFRKSPASH